MSTRKFTLRKMLRNPNNRLLERFFSRLRIELPRIQWSRLPGYAEDELLVAVRKLSVNQRQTVDRCFSEIYELCSDGGIQAILEAARFLAIPDFTSQFPYGCRFGIALWTWLEYPLVFEHALTLDRLDNLSRSYRRLDLPRKQPNRSAGAIEGLARGLSNLFQIEEGRGENCTVQHVQRSGQLDCFLAYTDNYVQSIPIHDDAGDLSVMPVRPTFETVFVYDHVEGAMDLYASGLATRTKKALISMFGQIMLNADVDPHRFQHAYDPNRIRDSYFALPTDPADGARADVVGAWFESNRLGKVGLVPPPGGDVLNMAKRLLNQKGAKWSELNLRKASIRFRFDACAGRRASSLNFDVSYPCHCSVRSRRPEQVELVRKYLRRWRVARV